mgnify:CR=1 FL=1
MKKVLIKKTKTNGNPQKKEQIEEENLIPPSENPVYLKMGYYESLEAKRDLLSSEMSFLNLLKTMKRYNSLRLEEMRLKSEMYKAIRELDLSLRKTKSSFPFLKIPERARRQEIVEKEASEEIKPVRDTFDEDLESQLRNIQEKLKSIGR